MKIALCNSRRGWGGASSMAVELARGLRARGHDVVVFCKMGSALHRALDAEIRVEPILGGADFPLPAIARCVRAFRRHGTEVALCSVRNDIRMVAPAARLTGVPVAMRRVHGYAFGRGLVDRLFDRLPARYIANSGFTRDVMLASASWLTEGAVSLVPNGIDVERFAMARPASLGLPETAVTVGFVGRMDSEKGVLELGAAWPAIVERVPDAHLVIVGSGGEEREVRRRLGSARQVHFLGFRGDVPAVLRALDLLVVPSRSEAFGLAAVEAMAAGVPVVATRVGGLPEVIADGIEGILVPPADPDALAEAVVAMLRDPERMQRMGRAGRKRARREFDIARVVRSYEAVLHDLAHAGRGQPAEVPR